MPCVACKSFHNLRSYYVRYTFSEYNAINTRMNGKQLPIPLLSASDCAQPVPPPPSLALEHHHSLYRITSTIIPLLEHALNGTRRPFRA